MKKRTIALMLALVLVIGCAIGGTIAWLTDVTDPVENTFTTSDVDITLAETTGEEYKMVPGSTITKDPKVTVLADSEDCYLFVKVEKSANFDSYMEYAMADGWIALDGYTGVFYREVAADDANQEFAVLKNNTVTVKNSVTKAMMDALTEAACPTLTFTAYACQQANVADAAAAWGYISNLANS